MSALAGVLAAAALALVPVPVPPPAGAVWDYQLGGAVAPAPEVTVVTRDRGDAPAADRYGVCYVNAFQTQAAEKRFWHDTPSRWRLVLKRHGRPVVDSAWGEWLLDTSTPYRRGKLAAIVGRWVDGCAEAGYDAVEPDNLDSYQRSHGLLRRAENLAFARLLVARAHARGLAIGQKNLPELGAAGPRTGFDFAVAEECGQYDECADLVAAYGDEVLAVEYTDAGFARACAAVGDRLGVERRDRGLTAGGVRRWC